LIVTSPAPARKMGIDFTSRHDGDIKIEIVEGVKILHVDMSEVTRATANKGGPGGIVLGREQLEKIVRPYGNCFQALLSCVFYSCIFFLFTGAFLALRDG
jgi:hypothetical protein